MPGRRLALLLLACGVAVGVPAASAFDIGLGPTFLGGLLEPHGGTAIHEGITADAVKAGSPTASAALILDLQRGVENADITHQFDSETHFDNSSLGLNRGRAVPGRTPNFGGAFDTAHERFAAAVKLARGNPQFLNPDFKSFGELVANVRTTFAKLAVLPSCVATRACPTAFFATEAARLTVWGAPLALNPDPDPHQPTGENSVFTQHCPANPPKMCGKLGGVNAYYTGMMPTLQRDLDRGLAALKAVYGASDPDTVAVKRYRQDLAAYLAYQLLGHAFHSTEDFFAHSNYVELMSGVEPSTSIAAAKPALKPADTAVPASWADFSIAGVSKLLGAKAGRLETGAVGAIWLNDGDFCKSSADPFFNPVYFSKLKLPVVTFNPWPKVTWVPFPGLALGANPDPPNPFHYCHYPTATTVGLNKDDDKTEKHASRSSHANHAYARAAATKLAGVLWCDFLQQIGSACNPGTGGGGPKAFSAPLALSPKGAHARYPATGIDAAGRATVVWTQIASRADLRYSVRKNRSWSAPVVIPGSESFGPEDPVLSVSPSGNAVVVANGSRVVAALRRGPTFGPMTALTPEGVGDSYAAAISDSGRAVVAWRTDEGQIQVATAEPGGGFGAPVTVPSGGSEAADPSVGIDGSGNAIVAWAIDSGDAGAAIQYALMPSEQGLGVPSTLGRAAGAHGTDTLPALDVTPDGKAAIAWDDTDDCDNCAWIFVLRGATGTTTGGFGSPFLVSTAEPVADGGKVYDNAVSAGTGGPAAYVWSEASDSGDRIGFRTGSGSSLGGFQHLGANLGLLWVTSTGDRFLVAWAGQTDSGERVRVASSTGGPLALELDSAWTSIGGMTIAANRSGSAVVAWDANDGTDNRVYVSTSG